MAESKKEVAEKADTAMAEYGAYEEYAGAGFENQTSDDYAIPFIHVLQQMSPQLEEDDNLKAGMVINTVTGEVWPGKTGIAFVPATTQHVYVAWKPRDEGGGFMGVHQPDSELVRNCVANQAFGEYTTPDGNELSETFYVYGMAVDDDGSASEAVIAFTSSKIKKYKGWMTKAKTVQIPLPDGRKIPAPLFAHRYRLTTVTEKNNKGTFANWQVDFDGENAEAARLAPDDDLFQAAVNVKKLLEAGQARADYDHQGGHEESAGNGEVF